MVYLTLSFAAKALKGIAITVHPTFKGWVKESGIYETDWEEIAVNRL